MAKLQDFKPQRKNANKHTPRGSGMVNNSMKQDGYSGEAMVAAADREMFIGSNRHEQALDVFGPDVEPIIVESDGTRPVIVVRTDIPNADDPRAVRLGHGSNRTAQVSYNPDIEVLAEIQKQDAAILESLYFPNELVDLGVMEQESADAEPQTDRAAELLEKWGVETGSLWQIGDHRLICGDCTDPAVVARVMGGEKAILVHADPPYGMGQENEGIENDNLYREKLDAFQMQWWSASRPFVEDNGSTYIWGTAEDLWRLWYLGGLRDSERLTFRNEIVWTKEGAQGSNSDAHRMYPTGSERCIFFMLGEQGFSINADVYWEGWEGVRVYLKTERDKMGWDNAKCKELAGHSPTSGCHWFDKSQWTMPTQDVYEAWQNASNDAFKKDYDELKKEFYSTRAYFDNTHDLMTDVWQFNRVQGEDRHGHATPKPVEMMERVIMSSSPADAPVLVPFNGTGPELVACENLSRKCRAIEISPAYCAVTLERMATAFPALEIARIL